MKEFCTSLVFICFSLFSFSQTNTFYITGKVLNSDNGMPLPGASVYAQNTTSGTATDSEGNFKLWLPPGGYDIIVTFTGYETESKRVTSSESENNNLNFILKTREKEMSEVSVVSTNEVKNGWEKYGSFFLDEFIGKTVNSEDCKILNPQVIKFFFSKRKNKLKIVAEEPVVIENKALGYNIKYALDSFIHEYNTGASMYTGYPLFEEMVPDSEQKKIHWDSLRSAAYQGSLLHFMRSMYAKQLKEQGFEIQFVVKADESDNAIKLKNQYGAMNYVMDDSTQTVEIRPNQLQVGVIYTKAKPSSRYKAAFPDEPDEFQFSLLSFLPSESITIEQNGYYYDQSDLTIQSYWAWKKVADLLPYDYTE